MVETKELIELSRRINRLSISGSAVVKSQRMHDPFPDGVSPNGLYYEGVPFPHELAEYIGQTECDITLWVDGGMIKLFVSPD